MPPFGRRKWLIKTFCGGPRRVAFLDGNDSLMVELIISREQKADTTGDGNTNPTLLSILRVVGFTRACLWFWFWFSDSSGHLGENNELNAGEALRDFTSRPI